MAQGDWFWHELHTPDVDAAKAFYKEVFGWGANTVNMGSGDLGRDGALHSNHHVARLPFSGYNPASGMLSLFSAEPLGSFSLQTEKGLRVCG